MLTPIFTVRTRPRFIAWMTGERHRKRLRPSPNTPCYSRFQGPVNLGESPRRPIAIQAEMGHRGSTPFRKYQDLVVGTRSLFKLVLFELVTSLTWLPGALGLILRKLLYPLVLASVGRNVVFGQGVVLRHPGKIRIGDDVTVDDLVLLDAKGAANGGITIGNGVFLGRGTILSCKDGDITLGDHVNIGFHSEIFSASSVTVGDHGLFAAYTYLVGGGHEFESTEKAVIDQPRT